MHKIKETLVVAFALFSLFFGAGNLILPPLLGFKSGELWWLVALGFCISAVLIPIMGILAHAKLQGTIFDFGKKVSTNFSLIYATIVYIISISLPSPRTASVTHEMAIQPFFNSSSLLTSVVYFVLVLIFVLNRSKILGIIGKILTPVIVLVLFTIIGICFFSNDFVFDNVLFESPFTDGILEGYQTFDAIGSVVVGGVILVSIDLRRKGISYEDKKKLVMQSGWLAGLGLFIIYSGLIITGALMFSEFAEDVSRTELLKGLSLKTLGNTGNMFLSVLVSLACFTTAVGIVTGAADFVKSRFRNSQKVYNITAMIGCLLGVIMGQFDVHYIIAIALPALMFIYPITIILILLNILPNKFATSKVFRVVVITTIIFSVPDFLNSIGLEGITQPVQSYIPLSKYSMGWVLPAFLAFIITAALNPQFHQPQ